MALDPLYFSGSPNWQLTCADLKEVKAKIGRDQEVRLVSVQSNREARRLKFVGSPTVHVNGQDKEPDVPTTGFNLECQLYWVEGRPAREWLVNGICEALSSTTPQPKVGEHG